MSESDHVDEGQENNSGDNASNLWGCFPNENNDGSFDSLDSDRAVNEDGQRISQTKSAMESKVKRVGHRYYEAQEGYDKRVYENEPSNYARITATLFVFWIFNALHWWACFELGIYDTWAYTVYSLIIFCWTVFFIGVMLWSGKGSNKVARKLAFLKEVIAEEKAKRIEAQEKEKTDKEY